jgi:hypothetical protein
MRLFLRLISHDLAYSALVGASASGVLMLAALPALFLHR